MLQFYFDSQVTQTNWYDKLLQKLAEVINGYSPLLSASYFLSYLPVLDTPGNKELSWQSVSAVFASIIVTVAL